MKFNLEKSKKYEKDYSDIGFEKFKKVVYKYEYDYNDGKESEERICIYANHYIRLAKWWHYKQQDHIDVGVCLKQYDNELIEDIIELIVNEADNHLESVEVLNIEVFDNKRNIGDRLIEEHTYKAGA